MTVVPLDRIAVPPVDDVPAIAEAHGHSDDLAAFARALGDAFASAGSALSSADAAERAFASRHGGLQEMVLERARADVELAIANAAASRTAQALTTLLGMQV